MGFKTCCCCCCGVFAMVFVSIFFFAVGKSVKRSSVHHILENVEVSNFTMSTQNSAVLESASLAFKVWSRNANQKMGVRFRHIRIAVLYSGVELGRAYVPTPFIQPPHNVTHLQAPLHLANLTLPSKVAEDMRYRVKSGEIRLRIRVKVRASYKRVDKSWETKLGGGQLRGDDKCDLLVSLSTKNSTGSSSLECGWTVRWYNPDA